MERTTATKKSHFSRSHEEDQIYSNEKDCSEDINLHYKSEKIMITGNGVEHQDGKEINEETVVKNSK